MEIITKEEYQLKKEIILDYVLKGKIFLHPTDTIYGIGCDATNSSAVKKIREIKGKYERPFSIIAPSKTWIRENCEVTQKEIEWLKKLPGPYTLILKLKNKNAVARETNNGLGTIGIRIINHWFQEVAEKTERPIVTTSANAVGKEFMTSLDNLDSKIKRKLDFIIYEGIKEGKPSTIVDLTSNSEQIKNRN